MVIGPDCWERLRKAGIIKSQATWKADIRAAHPAEVMRISDIGPVKAFTLYRSAGSKITLEKVREIYDRLNFRTSLDQVKARHFSNLNVGVAKMREDGFDADQVRRFVAMCGHRNPIKYQVFKPTMNGKIQKYSVRNVFAKDAGEVVELAKVDNGKGIVCIGINDLEGGSDIRNVVGILLLAIDVDVRKERKVGYVSTPDDHEMALAVALMGVKVKLEEMGFKVAMVVDSGNGAHVYVKVSIPLQKGLSREEWFGALVYRRLLAIEDVIRKFNNDVVVIDFLTKDVVRRMKMPGTLNVKDTAQKETRMCSILYEAEDFGEEGNNAAFAKVEPVKEAATAGSGEDVADSSELGTALEKDEKLKDLMDGKWEKYGFKSRSEAEQALLNKLIFYKASNKQIYEVMEKCGIGKWQEAPENYRRLSVAKARGFAKNSKSESLSSAVKSLRQAVTGLLSS